MRPPSPANPLVDAPPPRLGNPSFVYILRHFDPPHGPKPKESKKDGFLSPKKCIFGPPPQGTQPPTQPPPPPPFRSPCPPGDGITLPVGYGVVLQPPAGCTQPHKTPKMGDSRHFRSSGRMGVLAGKGPSTPSHHLPGGPTGPGSRPSLYIMRYFDPLQGLQPPKPPKMGFPGSSKMAFFWPPPTPPPTPPPGAEIMPIVANHAVFRPPAGSPTPKIFKKRFLF